MTGPDTGWAQGTYEEIAARVSAGTGSRAGFDAVEAWKRARRTLVDCDALITRAYVDAAAGWSGDAYAAFRASMGPITQWVADATTEATNTAIAIDMQGAHADELKRVLPPVPSAGAGAGDLAAATEDARRLAQQYVAATSRTRDDLNTWTQPPSVTVQVPTPGSASRSAVRGTGGTVVGPAAGGAAAAGTAGAVVGGVPGVPPARGGGAAGGTAGTGTGVPGARSGQPRPAGGAASATGTGMPGPGGVSGPGRAPFGAIPMPAGAGGTGPSGGRAGGTASGAAPFGAGAALGGTADRAVDRIPALGREPGVALVPGAPGLPGTGGGAPSHRTVPGYGTAEALPPGAGGRGRRPPDPGWSVPGREPAARTPSWRDVVTAEPAPAESAGSRAGPAERPGLYPPMVGTGGAGGQGGTRRRPDFLVDDSGAFTDDRWFPGPVIGSDDPMPRPAR